jgi:hypothetical protein
MRDPSNDSRPAAIWTPPWQWNAVSVRALMKVRGNSAHALAKAVYACSRTVEGWIYEGVIPNPDSAKQLYRLWAELDSWQREVFDALRANPPRSKSKEPGMDRRQATVAAITGPFVVPETWERLAAGDRFPVDVSLIKAHEDMAADLAAKYATWDLRVLLPSVAVYADQALKVLDRPMPSSLRRRLEVVVAGAHVEAGLLAFHAGDRALARHHFAEAVALAFTSGDATLQAQTLAEMSILYSAQPRGGIGGDPKHVLKLLKQASSFARGADGDTRARIAITQADEAIALGAVDACHASLRDAEQALAGPPTGGRQGFLGQALRQDDEEYLERVRGGACGLSGRFNEAEQVFARLLHSATSPRHQVIAVTKLGDVRLRAEEPEGTCQALTQGLHGATATGYTTGIERICGVRTRFPKPWRTLACVRELDEQLQLAAGSSLTAPTPA